MTMTRYQLAALIGIIIMGISSFVACLSKNDSAMMAGNVGLLVSIIIMSYGFNKWQP